MTPSSGIRTSIDKGFRIRSHSEAIPRPRTESIQEARRKFAEKERLKEEKAAREEIARNEKRAQKEARQIERGHRRSSASQDNRSKRSNSDIKVHQEKDGLVGRGYNSIPVQTPPDINEGFEERPRRSSTSNAKKKTHSAWTKFMMWFRTRIIRLGKKSKRT